MTLPAKTQAPPTPVRLPDDLKKDLQEAATENDRSLNGEIVNRLRSTFRGKRSAAGNQASSQKKE